MKALDMPIVKGHISVVFCLAVTQSELLQLVLL